MPPKFECVPIGSPNTSSGELRKSKEARLNEILALPQALKMKPKIGRACM